MINELTFLDIVRTYPILIMFNEYGNIRLFQLSTRIYIYILCFFYFFL